MDGKPEVEPLAHILTLRLEYLGEEIRTRRKEVFESWKRYVKDIGEIVTFSHRSVKKTAMLLDITPDFELKLEGETGTVPLIEVSNLRRTT
jgi:biotin-(acetyl-CoA carboxylase) ligase